MNMQYRLIELRQTPIAQDYIRLGQVISGHAIQNRMSAGGIIADHSAHRGAFRRGRIGAEHQSMLCGLTI